MSDCEKYIELISSMVDSELTHEQEAELRTHLESCSECRKVYDAFKGISDALSEDMKEPPEMLAEGVMYKIGLKNKGVNNRRFAFGRFTAIAACFVLIMFGASHLGLFNGAGKSTAMSAAAPKAAETKNSSISGEEDKTGTYDSTSPQTSNDGNSAAMGKSAYMAKASPETAVGGEAANAEQPDIDQSLMTAGGSNKGTEDDATLQYGFSSQQTVMMVRQSLTDSDKEPADIFTADELTVYSGKYNSEAEDNKLVTVKDKAKLSALTELLAAVSDSQVDYTTVDTKFIVETPSYTLLVPVSHATDESAADKTIGVWFVKGETWCVLADASTNDNSSSTVKILYKAVGLQEKLENQLKQLEN